MADFRPELYPKLYSPLTGLKEGFDAFQDSYYKGRQDNRQQEDMQRRWAAEQNQERRSQDMHTAEMAKILRGQKEWEQKSANDLVNAQGRIQALYESGHADQGAYLAQVYGLSKPEQVLPQKPQEPAVPPELDNLDFLTRHPNQGSPTEGQPVAHDDPAEYERDQLLNQASEEGRARIMEHYRNDPNWNGPAGLEYKRQVEQYQKDAQSYDGRLEAAQQRPTYVTRDAQGREFRINPGATDTFKQQQSNEAASRLRASALAETDPYKKQWYETAANLLEAQALTPGQKTTEELNTLLKNDTTAETARMGSANAPRDDKKQQQILDETALKNKRPIAGGGAAGANRDLGQLMGLDKAVEDRFRSYGNLHHLGDLEKGSQFAARALGLVQAAQDGETEAPDLKQAVFDTFAMANLMREQSGQAMTDAERQKYEQAGGLLDKSSQRWASLGSGTMTPERRAAISEVIKQTQASLRIYRQIIADGAKRDIEGSGIQALKSQGPRAWEGIMGEAYAGAPAPLIDVQAAKRQAAGKGGRETSSMANRLRRGRGAGDDKGKAAVDDFLGGR